MRRGDASAEPPAVSFFCWLCSKRRLIFAGEKKKPFEGRFFSSPRHPSSFSKPFRRAFRFRALLETEMRRLRKFLRKTFQREDEYDVSSPRNHVEINSCLIHSQLKTSCCKRLRSCHAVVKRRRTKPFFALASQRRRPDVKPRNAPKAVTPACHAVARRTKAGVTTEADKTTQITTDRRMQNFYYVYILIDTATGTVS